MSKVLYILTSKHVLCTSKMQWLRWQSSGFLPGRPGLESCHLWFLWDCVSKLKPHCLLQHIAIKAPELHSRAAPSVEAHQCQQSWHRKKFRRKVDNKKKCFVHQSMTAEWLEPAPSNSRVPGLNTARAAPLKYNLYLMVILWQKIITECTLNRSGSSGLWIDMWVLFPITGRSANVLFKVLKC